jgi:hypothetical protein
MNDKEDLLCFNDTQLFIVNCSDGNSAINDSTDIIADLSSLQIKDACFTKAGDIIASFYDRSSKLNKVFIYRKTEDSWQAKDLGIDKNIIAMKSNLFTHEVCLFYNNK